MDGGVLTEPAALLEREHEVEPSGGVACGGRRAGGALVIEGAAGIGKSRLLEEARAEAEPRPDRAQGAGHRARAGLPVRGDAPVVRSGCWTPMRASASAGWPEQPGWPRRCSPAQRSAGSSGPPAPAIRLCAAARSLLARLEPRRGCRRLCSSSTTCSGATRPRCSALMFIARRLDGQPLALIMATRPLEAGASAEATALVVDPAVEVLRPGPLQRGAVARAGLGAAVRRARPRFLRACVEVTGGNPFYVGELLSELAARGIDSDGRRRRRPRRDRPAGGRQRRAAAPGPAAAFRRRARPGAERARRRSSDRRRGARWRDVPGGELGRRDRRA